MGCCCSVPRSLVSKKKIRIQDDTPNGGVDLDLTVIDKQIVCMGFPAEGLESWYRNPYDDVVAYLDHRFGDKYMVYNLCSEAQHVYPPEKFYGRVAYFPFPDHHACPLAMLPAFVSHAVAYLSADPERVVVVHCKAGKGRTGIFACCLLMNLVPRLRDAESAMRYYGTARTHDGKGLTIPSQRRYVAYYGSLLLMSNGEMPKEVPVVDFKSITLRGVFHAVPFRVVEVIAAEGSTVLSTEPTEGDQHEVLRSENGDITLDVSRVPSLQNVKGDIRINLKASATDKSWLAALSVHTLFIKKGYTFSEIDKLYKMKSSDDAGIFFDFMEVMTREASP